MTEASRRLGEQLGACVEKQPALGHGSQPGVAPECFLHQFVHLGDRLDAGVAGTSEYEGQPLRGAAGIGVSELELMQDVVPQRDRVGEILQPVRVFVESRQGRKPGDRAEGDYELLIADLPDVRVGCDVGDAAVSVDAGDAATTSSACGHRLGCRPRHAVARGCPRQPPGGSVCRA